jgi:hypothetical protein
MRQSLARKSSDLSPIGERTEDEAETDWEDGVPVDKGSRSRSRWASLSSEGATTASSGAESADLSEEEEEEEEEEEGVDGLGSDATARAQRAAEAEGGGSSDGGGSGAGLDRRPNARSSGDGFGDDEATDGEERRGEQATRGGSRERTRTVDFDDDFDDDDDEEEAAAWDAADGLGWDGDASQVSDCGDTFSEASSVYDDDADADDGAPTKPDNRTNHLEPPLHLANPSSARTSASARTSSEKALSSLPSRASAASNEGAEEGTEEAPGDLAAGKPGGTLAESTAASGQASPRRESFSHGKPAPFEERRARGFATPRAAASAPGKAGAESRQPKTPLAPLKSATPTPDAAGLRDSVETLSPRRDLNRPLARAMSS